jgi:protein-ribulosamine 3-kinase
MNNLSIIIAETGLQPERIERIQGGDINEAYCLITSTEKFFLKVNNNASHPLMFEKEAHGLELLRKNSTIIVPKIIKHGFISDQQYLLLEWLEKGSPQKNMWERFGGGLALMHQQPQQYFGLNEDNYIGTRQQCNQRAEDWQTFYTEFRIMPLVRSLCDSQIYSLNDIKKAASLCSKFEKIFPQEPPSLLHGDLWGGNYLIHASGHAAIYDPAVYFGHREMDIGMTKLFGGFDQRFYAAYNEIYPLEKEWEKRLPLTQLYPLLVHASLFGGHYISEAREMIRQFA